MKIPRKKRLSLDIDGVLLDMFHGWREWLKATPSLDRPLPDVAPESHHHWDIRECWGLTPRQLEDMWDFTYRCELPPYPYSQQYVDFWRHKYDVVVVSARARDDAQQQAVKLLDVLYKIPEEVIYFSDDKLPTLKWLEADAHVDDKWKIADNLGRTWEGQSFLLDRPWNKSLDFSARYKRIFSYNEVQLDRIGDPVVESTNDGALV